jgi:hypothetical protein
MQVLCCCSITTLRCPVGYTGLSKTPSSTCAQAWRGMEAQKQSCAHGSEEYCRILPLQRAQHGFTICAIPTPSPGASQCITMHHVPLCFWYSTGAEHTRLGSGMSMTRGGKTECRVVVSNHVVGVLGFTQSKWQVVPNSLCHAFFLTV